ncbi:AraC family transcriptional regulator [Pseudomonas sp. gcc21]|uniref:AraC family transcriptional regulator n=1 Tax=Pseudomonas sp. gcc21 TaxID=2726989 RepID=UPI0014510CE6|nr:AraC family transcriptional regulator [Pseudomonas sp. gcc21]QJD59197.1 AraC family transcriptional regulator [Pseudomonas sp. gcc21]
MRNFKLTEMSETPREWSGWSRVITQSLSARGLRFQDSPLAERLIRRLDGREIMDQTTSNLLWQEAQSLSGDDWLGLSSHCAEGDLPLSLQMIGLTVSASLNMSAAVNNLVRFFPLVSTQAALELRVTGDDARLMLHPRGRPHPQHMAALVNVMGRLLLRCARRGGIESPEILIGVSGLNGAPPELPWSVECVAADTWWVKIPRQWLDLSIPESSPGLLHGMTGVLHGVLARGPINDIVEKVRHAIHQGMSRGVLGEEYIAEPMGISTRHLRRLLGQHGTSYERLLDEVRRDAALRLLADSASSLTRIAYELGFQDPSSFTRAFRRWTGYSPSDFRRRQARMNSLSASGSPC